MMHTSLSLAKNFSSVADLKIWDRPRSAAM